LPSQGKQMAKRSTPLLSLTHDQEPHDQQTSHTSHHNDNLGIDFNNWMNLYCPPSPKVEMVLDKRVLGNKLQYLVKWEGQPSHDATWEKLEHLKNATGKINEYESMRTSIFKERRM